MPDQTSDLDMPESAPRRGLPAARRPVRRVAVAAVAVVTLAAIWLASSIVPVLVEPGTDPVAARLAEWAREHGLGAAVTAAEQLVYVADKPAVGGAAEPLPSVAEQSAAATTASGPAAPAAPPAPPSRKTALPAALTPIVQPPMAGEGQWQPLLSVGGQVAAEVTFLRPDPVHTSYLVGVVWLDPTLLRFALHQGAHVPGGPMVAPDHLTPEEQSSVLAAFNSGFQMADSNGGYYQNGTVVAPLVTGAASMVFGHDGSMKVQAWPGGAPAPDVAAVRQNLVLMVDQGKATPATSATVTSVWGKTVGNAAYVWRSGVGQRPDGSLISVVGPAMNIGSLTRVMLTAGTSTAMELDINKDWTSFITYGQPGAKPAKLTPDQVPPANRYQTTSTRDFVAVLPR